jgi:hypothetical protein
MSECRDQHNHRRQILPLVLLLGLALAFSASPARGQEPYAAEPATAKASAYLPQSIVDGLDPQGSRLVTFVNGLKTPVSEVWWSKNVMTQESPANSSGILYGNLKVGALVGVVHYLAESSEDFREDFRDQKLRPGYYTMRYAQTPADHEHKDVSPYRDFVLLSPVSVDREPDKILGMDELLKWSRLASHGRHPAIMSLVPVDTGYKNFPVVRTDDAGTCILQVKLHGKPEKGGSPQELGFAVIMVTPIKENGES